MATKKTNKTTLTVELLKCGDVKRKGIPTDEQKPGNSSQSVMSGKAIEPLRSQTVISKGKGERRYIPYTFTEQGVAMLSSAARFL
ncbi:MAG: ORF6N domain-containing protein [Polaromonas sp.]